MDVKDYLTLWFLKHGTRPLPHDEWIIAVHDDEESNLYQLALSLGYAERHGAWDDPSIITPKGLEFIKNG